MDGLGLRMGCWVSLSPWYQIIGSLRMGFSWSPDPNEGVPVIMQDHHGYKLTETKP